MKVMDILPCSAKGENMRGWRNWLARVPYKHEAMGSSPLLRTKNAAIAQLGRAADCHSEGREFEPR